MTTTIHRRPAAGGTMGETRARYLRFAFSTLLLAAACETSDPPAPPTVAADAAAPDAPAQVSGTDGPTAARDLPPYERMPPPPPPTGHGWTVKDIGVGATGGQLVVVPQGVGLVGGGLDI